MAKEFCEVCGGSYNARPASKAKPGYYGLCRVCRYSRNDPNIKKYLCEGVNTTRSKTRDAGEPCTHFKLFGSNYCSQHQEDNTDA